MKQDLQTRKPSMVLITLLFLLLPGLPGKAWGQGAATNWIEEGKTAKVGAAGAADVDVTLDGTTYTVHTPAGLAWIAWVTNEGKTHTSADGVNFPATAGFTNCTVELSGSIELSDKSWTPIGYRIPYGTTYPFKGTFNGKGHQINALTITDGALNYIGLFGYTENAKIRNLGVVLSVKGINITRVGGEIGGLAGSLKNSTIENCYVTGGAITVVSEKGNTSYIGGIAGNLNASSVINCYSTIDITATGEGDSEIGGIVGSGITITQCYSTSTLTGKNVRGIGSGTINSCLALNPSIYTTDTYARVGGGKETNYASADMKVYKNNELTTPPVHTKHGTDCYRTNNLSFLGDAYDFSADYLPCLKMLNEDKTYSQWSGSQPAGTLLKSTYLPLPGSWMDVYEAKVSTDDTADLDVWLEKTASGDIYHVRTAIGLSWIGYVVKRNLPRSYDNNPLIPENTGFEGCTVVLDQDIDLAAGGMGELDWLPIGYNGAEASTGSSWVNQYDFKGIFDGQFHTVSNMKMAKLGDTQCSNTDVYLGLFGYTRNGQIKNLTVQGSIKLEALSLPVKCGTSGTYVGGLVGAIGVNGSVTNCVSKVSIEITDATRVYDVGGLVGYNGRYIDESRSGRSVLANSSSTGVVKVSAQKVTAGGITAFNKGDVLNCYSTSDVEATGTTKGYPTYAGGIVGWNNGNSALLQYCYATGFVLATNNSQNVASAGGICGYNNEMVKNCLALNRSDLNEGSGIKGKSVGRVAGYSAGTKGVEANSASTRILINEVDASTILTTNKEGANTYLDTYRKDLIANPASDNYWGKAWAFDDTNLPKLKRVNADGTSYGAVLSGQPDLPASNYLKSRSDYNTALTLPEGDKESSMTLTNIDGTWFYYGPDGSPGLPFSGTVTSGSNPAFCGKIEIIDVPEGASPLILDGLKAVSADGVNLTISSSANVTIQTTGNASSLDGASCICIESGGQLTLAGNNLSLIAKNKPVLNEATPAVNGLSLLEWVFDTAPNATLSWSSTGETPTQGTAQLGTDRCVLAIPATVGVPYTLSAGMPNPVRQQAKLIGASTGVVTFSAPSAGVTSYKEVKKAPVVHLIQPDDGGMLVAKIAENDFPEGAVADGTILTLGNHNLPGYTFEEYLSGTAADNITNKVSGSTVTIADNSADVYLSVSFKQPSSIEGTEPEKTPPTAPVTDNPIVVVDDDALPDGANSSLIRLITDEPTPDNKTAMEAIVKKADTQFDQVVYTEIALVEITKDPDGKILTTAPIQPKDGKSVTLYCPYPTGTNSSYTFTIFHKKWDGTTKSYSTALQNLENTPNGLMFRVSSFSPFAIAYTKPQTPPVNPDPVPPVYYNVVLPSVEGVITDPIAGTYACESWSSFTFALTLAADYDQSVPVVTTSRGETLTPRPSDGRYEIKYVREDLSILISGVSLNDENPTANADVRTDAVRVWAADGVVHIFTPVAAEVRLVSFSGALLKSARVPSGDSMMQAPEGPCIIQVGNQRFKIISSTK